MEMYNPPHPFEILAEFHKSVIVDEELALKLAELTNTRPVLWLQLQKQYDGLEK